MTRCRLTLLISLVLIQAGCAASLQKSVPRPGTRPPAGNLALDLETVNRGLTTCKGIGRIKIQHAGRTQRLRIAWISSLPEKLRIAVLGVDGRPLVTVSSDGIWFYLQDHTTGKFQKTSLGDLRLKAILRLPIDVRSLALILAGRMPRFDYDRTAAAVGRTDGETVVVLKKWWNRVGRIYVGPDRSAAASPAIHRIEAYRRNGELQYIADITATRVVDEYVVPRSLTLASGADRFTLDIDRYWANEPVPPSAFVLPPPE